MNKYLIPYLTLFFFTCESPERVWDNPNDSEGTLDPSEWSPTNLVILRLSSNEISLSWEYDRDNIDGFKIDRRINENDWVVEYGTVEKESRKWTDTDAIASDLIIYEYRIYAYAGSNTSAYNTTIYNENAPQSVNVTSVTYTTENMIVAWGKYPDEDFASYELLTSGSQNGLFTILDTIVDVNTTSYSTTEFNPLIKNWFKIRVTNDYGLSTIGNGMTNEIDSPPTQINISSITYDLTEMVITWGQSNDYDFVSYELLQSDSEDGIYSSVVVITDQFITSHSMTEYDPTQENWFKVKVTDLWGLNSTGTGMTNAIDSPPNQPEINPIVYEDGSFIISWAQNNDSDFLSYKLYESLSDDMSNSTLIYEIENRTDTTFTKSTQNVMYYQIVVEDYWGQQAASDIEFGDIFVDLWGVSYSITNTDTLDLAFSNLSGEIPNELWSLTNLLILDLFNNEFTGTIPSAIGNLSNLLYLELGFNQLSGFIPSEIENLTNLSHLGLSNNQLLGEIPVEIGNLTQLLDLRLHNNQLTGEIPESICNLNIGEMNYINISNNQLCPPYPSCIEDYVGEQDTSDCP